MRRVILAIAVATFSVPACPAQQTYGQPAGPQGAAAVPPAGDYVLTNRQTGQSFEVIISPTGQMYAVDNPQLKGGVSQNEQAAQPGGGMYPGAPAVYAAGGGAYGQGQSAYAASVQQPAGQQSAGFPQQQPSYQQLMQQQQAQLQAQGQGQGQDSTSQTAQTQDQQQQPHKSKAAIVGSALSGALGMYYNYKYGGMMGSGYPGYGGYGYPGYGYPGYSYPAASPATSSGGGIGSMLKSLF